MNRHRGIWLWALVLAVCGFFCTATAEVLVFAAASLTDSLREIGENYRAAGGDRVTFNFGATSVLARQLLEGARADLFLSADEAHAARLDAAGLLVPETRRTILSNSLVVVVASDSRLRVRSADDLTTPEIRRLALADPKAVPAGVYARQYLEKAGVWPAVEPKIVPLDNVRSVLSAVASGDLEVGIVYKTDAAISSKVKIAYEVPLADTPSIGYAVAALREAPHLEAGRKFLAYLESGDAAPVFRKFGFIVVDHAL
jgi:molybdate transport system substrate-binding protein